MLDVLLDPVRRQKAADDQIKLREKHGHRVPNDPALVHYFWGCAREDQALASLQPDDFQADQSFFLNQLAEGYAAQCRFAEAAAATKSDAHRTDYLEKAKAVEGLGSIRCDCPPTLNHRLPNDAKGLNVSSQKPVERLHDGEKLIVLNRCLHCGTISAANG